MKIFKQSIKYGVAVAGTVGTSVAMAAGTADAELITAATSAIENGAATSKGVLLLFALGLATIIAVSWGISALKRSRG